MPETIPQIRPSFNRSLRLETRPELCSVRTREPWCSGS